MKKRYYTSFSKRLVLYLVSLLLITGSLVFISIFTFSREFITDNALYQANTIATNVSRSFERKIKDIESIPNTITGLFGNIDTSEMRLLPSKILTAYPFLSDCCLHYSFSEPNKDGCTMYAYRGKSGKIKTKSLAYRLTVPHKNNIIRKNDKQGFWSVKELDSSHSIISYFQPIKAGSLQTVSGLLELNFPLKHLTDFIYDIKIFSSGYVFVTDSEGDFIFHPDPQVFKYHNLKSFCSSPGIDYSSTLKKFTKDTTGYENVYKKGKKYFLYYTPSSRMDWHIGIICRYDDIRLSSSKFLWLVFAILGIGFLILYYSAIRIVKSSLYPLSEFTENVRKITNGQVNIALPEEYDNEQLKDLYQAFRYMQDRVPSYIQCLQTTTAKNQEIITEINLAQKIQKRFLPKDILLPANIELYGKLKQSRSVGGDLYEYFILDNKLYFVLGDVSGKGFPASLYMASVIKLFRYIASRQSSTAAICNLINTHMCDNTEDDMYVTMFIGIMDIQNGHIIYTNAGHPKPFIVYADGRICTLNDEPDVPIGILEDYKFQEYEYTLPEGSQILLYTDGITDAENINAQFFGKNRLIECINGATPKNPYTIVTRILECIQEHIQGTEQSDDLTILDILYKGTPQKESDA